MVRSLRHVLPLATALALAFTANLSHARTEAAVARVSYAELDLSKDAGVRALYARVRRAARSVCDGARVGPRQMRARTAACIDQAIQRAVDDIDVAALTAYDSQRRGARRLAER